VPPTARPSVLRLTPTGPTLGQAEMLPPARHLHVCRGGLRMLRSGSHGQLLWLGMLEVLHRFSGIVALSRPDLSHACCCGLRWLQSGRDASAGTPSACVDVGRGCFDHGVTVCCLGWGCRKCCIGFLASLFTSTLIFHICVVGGYGGFYRAEMLPPARHLHVVDVGCGCFDHGVTVCCLG